MAAAAPPDGGEGVLALPPGGTFALQVVDVVSASDAEVGAAWPVLYGRHAGTVRKAQWKVGSVKTAFCVPLRPGTVAALAGGTPEQRRHVLGALGRPWQTSVAFMAKRWLQPRPGKPHYVAVRLGDGALLYAKLQAGHTALLGEGEVPPGLEAAVAAKELPAGHALLLVDGEALAASGKAPEVPFRLLLTVPLLEQGVWTVAQVATTPFLVRSVAKGVQAYDGPQALAPDLVPGEAPPGLPRGVLAALRAQCVHLAALGVAAPFTPAQAAAALAAQLALVAHVPLLPDAVAGAGGGDGDDGDDGSDSDSSSGGTSPRDSATDDSPLPRAPPRVGGGKRGRPDSPDSLADFASDDGGKAPRRTPEQEAVPASASPARLDEGVPVALPAHVAALLQAPGAPAGPGLLAAFDDALTTLPPPPPLVAAASWDSLADLALGEGADSPFHWPLTGCLTPVPRSGA